MNCIECGKPYGTFKAKRRGVLVDIKRWACLSCGYNHVTSYREGYPSTANPRLTSLRIMERNPEKIKVLHECDCEGRRKIRHHPNYEKPFEIELLCFTCHWEAHEEMEPGFNYNDKHGAYKRLNSKSKQGGR